MTIRDEAGALLGQLTGSPSPEFRDGQLEAIEHLVEARGRVLVVQRTGWGKSAVYFIATRLLRDRGAGATVLISPLLALMRNQLQMAARAGVRAATINSDNRDEWESIEAAIHAGEVDLLLISPERLNNTTFRANVLPHLLGETGLLVVDEAHCISDWGHDFRPDYRRIARIIDALPAGVPVLCTTATANDRVVDDIVEQLGRDLAVHRGTLDRESLSLAVVDAPDPAVRLAYLAQQLPKLPGSGIIYCLTIDDTRRVAGWLRSQGIDAVAYSGQTDSDERVQIEERLLANEVKVVVATSALGMGFDKPDLHFVLHYQDPGSPIAYYQQVGRAGRGVAKSYGILLRGHEDVDIQDHFIETAFPSQRDAEEVVARLDEGPMKLAQLEGIVNVRKSRLEGMLKILEVEDVVARVDGGWARTTTEWSYPVERTARVTEQRRVEQRAMREYARTDGCRMVFLRTLLDDVDASPCGRCDRCRGTSVNLDLPPSLVAEAGSYLRDVSLTIEPRKTWGFSLESPRGKIPAELLLEEGRALCVRGDGGWGQVLRAAGDHLPDELLDAIDKLVRRWQPEVEWLTTVPSDRNGALLDDVVARLGDRLALPVVPALARTRDAPSQREMENITQQLRNVLGAFTVADDAPRGPVLLVDDLVDSRWTITVAGIALRDAGVAAVHPLALAKAYG
jgi:ATP-dependent DNA helicase RecQ